MALFELLNTLDRLDDLCRRKCTGCPSDLARKLSVSEATLYRLLKEIKEELHAPIAYDRRRQTYYYTQEGGLSIGFRRKLTENEMSEQKGGVLLNEKRENISPLSLAASGPTYLCGIKSFFHISI